MLSQPESYYIVYSKEDSITDFHYLLAKPVGYCTQYRLLIIVQTTMFDLLKAITMKL